MSASVFKKDVETACMSELVKIGMKKRKAGIATIAISPDIDGWVGLNAETEFKDGTVAINPFIGVRYNRMHEIMAEIENEKFHPYLPPTVAKNIGYLAPCNSFKQYAFTPDADCLSVAHDMASDIQRYGFPYMHDLMGVESLEKAISRDCLWIDKSERLLVMMLISGDKLVDLEEFVRGRMSDPKAIKSAVARFSAFSEKVIEKRKMQPE